jgi:hypothetical protein
MEDLASISQRRVPGMEPSVAFKNVVHPGRIRSTQARETNPFYLIAFLGHSKDLS